MIITPREALLLGIWGEVADAKGINVWAIKEGLIDEEQGIEITAEQIKYWLS